MQRTGGLSWTAVGILGVMVALSVLTSAQVLDLSPAQAEKCETKALTVLRRTPTSGAAAIRTVFTEPELNAYLKYRAQVHLPDGVTSPSVRLVGGGKVWGRATVDLDRVLRRGSGSWLDPTSYLTGRLPVTLSGSLVATNGRARFTVESADVNGIPVPPTFIQQVVAAYTRSPQLPDGVRIDQSYTLPAGISRIEVQASQAAVVQ